MDETTLTDEVQTEVMCRGFNSLMIFISCFMTVCILLRRKKEQYRENNLQLSQHCIFGET